MGQLHEYDLRTQRACGRDIADEAIEEEDRVLERGWGSAGDNDRGSQGHPEKSVQNRNYRPKFH